MCGHAGDSDRRFGESSVWASRKRRANRRQSSLIRFPNTAGIGVKPISVEGTERLVRAAIQWSLANQRKNINFVPPDEFVQVLNGLAEPPPR